ncbi:MAG: hypothetical protein AAB288_11470, partial [Acidobacteriota bacterium]
PAPIKATSNSGRVIRFGSSDIKALLIRYVNQHSKADAGVETLSLGGVCHLDSDSLRKAIENRTLTPEAWQGLNADTCFSVNAGAFHLALTNLVALRHESFVIDPQVDQDFTHFPIQSFTSETLGTPVETPDQHKEVQIKTSVTYVIPSASAPNRGAMPPVKTAIFRYSLELDGAGEIVGGTWLGSPIPQVIWMQNRPKFAADDETLEKLYTLSVSLPSRMAMHDFSAIDTEDLQMAVRDNDPLVVNKKYRLELCGDVPRGADGLRSFLKTAFRSLGNISIFRNTFADEDAVMSIEVQFHNATSFRALKQAIRAHSNGRSEVSRILR